MGLSLGPVLKASVKDLLRQREEMILNDWHDRILNTYARETAAFLKGQQDRFANPVAYAFREATEAIYRALMGDGDVDLVPIEYAMKIRAVQEHDPFEGVAFIHLIKDAVRESLGGFVAESELVKLDCRIDRIASIASEMFIMNRRKVAELGSSDASIVS